MTSLSVCLVRTKLTFYTTHIPNPKAKAAEEKARQRSVAGFKRGRTPIPHVSNLNAKIESLCSVTSEQ